MTEILSVDHGPTLARPQKSTAPPDIRGSAVLSRFTDFWLLGGTSMVVWAVMVLGQFARGSSEAVESHFVQMGAVFAILSIFCNYPHFMISYRFGYGRGLRFILRHWFCLLAVPVGLVALYTLAYFQFNADMSTFPWVIAANHFFERVGIVFRFGTLANFGTELLSVSVLMMSLTVGWHYSKQVFGCVMVYAYYDRYPIAGIQRTLLKVSLFSIAFFNFFYMSIYAPEYNENSLGKAYFFNIPMISLGLPHMLIPLTLAVVIASAIAVLGFVFFANFKKHGKWPSLNLVVPWVAFHIWWLPLLRQPEYYFLVIPFFHSLQYLPFAYRLESPKIGKGRFMDLRASVWLAVLLLAGFCAFELVPSLLDQKFETTQNLQTWFFMIAFAVFINIHHFFIDSVVWKFDQTDIRRHLLQPRT